MPNEVIAIEHKYCCEICQSIRIYQQHQCKANMQIKYATKVTCGTLIFRNT